MKNRIVLELDQDQGVWMAISSGPHSNEIQALFGTRTLPTSFTHLTDGLDVLAMIRNLNPGVEVLLA